MIASPPPTTVHAGDERNTRRRTELRFGATILAVLVLVLSLVSGAPANADQVREMQYWLDDYGIRQAWTRSQGEGVTVAIIDSGVDASHPSLKDAVIGGKDFSGYGAHDGSEGIGNAPDHGTLVASMVAGRGERNDSDDTENDDGKRDNGLIGVAPKANILTASVGFGLPGDVDEQIAEAIIWSVDNGADIINLSLSRNSPDWPTSWDRAMQYAFENDVLVIAAAGNRSSGTTMVGAPATMPGVFTVAGVDTNQKASDGASTQGITLSVAAPSEELVGALPGGGYALWSGTSGAAPLVAGVAALVLSASPELTADQLAARLIDSATPAGDPLLYGNGLINASAALRSTASATYSSLDLLNEWIHVHRRADSPVKDVDHLDGPVIVPITVEQITVDSFWDNLVSSKGWRTTIVPALFFGGFGLAALGILTTFGVHFLREARRR